MGNLIHRFASAHASRSCRRRWVSKRHGIPTPPIVGKTEHLSGDLFTVQSYRARSESQGIGGKHDVLRKPSRIELVPVWFLNETNGQRSVGYGGGEVARRLEAGLLAWIIDHDKRPVLEVLR